MPSISTRDRIRAIVPWWTKGALKISLAPLPYPVLRRLSLARHGGMQKPGNALKIFQRHFNAVNFARKDGGFRLLELGPGDSFFTAVIAAAHGAAAACFVDVGAFASSDVRAYQAMADHLIALGLPAPDLSACKTIDDVLTKCSARYETHGLASLRALPAESFDFIFSNAVMQAIYRDEVLDTLKELRRVIHPQGCSAHTIDLRDMLDQSIQHLRFTEKVWESKLIRTSGFYVNRFRVSELMDLARSASFEPILDEVNRWPKLPLPRRKLVEPYQHMADDDLQTATIRLMLRPA